MKRSILVFVISVTSILCACSQSPAEQPSDAQSPAEKQLDPQSPKDQKLDPVVPTNPTGDAKHSGDVKNEETGAAVVKQTKPVTPCKDEGVSNCV